MWYKHQTEWHTRLKLVCYFVDLSRFTSSVIDYGDGDGNVKKQWVKLAKQLLCTCITLVCTFLCYPCTTWNDQVLSFFEDGNSKVINSNISVWTRVRPPLFSLQLQLQLLSSNWVNWDNREMVWKDAEAIFQWACHGRCRCRIVRSPWHTQQHGIYLLNRSPLEKSFCYCKKLFGISNGF